MSLARMRTAESPSLRKKIIDLDLRGPKSRRRSERQQSSIGWEQTVQGVEKRVWETLINHTKARPFKPKPTTRKETRNSLDVTNINSNQDTLSNLTTETFWDQFVNITDETPFDMSPFTELQESSEYTLSCPDLAGTSRSALLSGQKILEDDNTQSTPFASNRPNWSLLLHQGISQQPYENLSLGFNTTIASQPHIPDDRAGSQFKLPFTGQMELDPGSFQSFEDFLRGDGMRF